jgi:hypothetical protein
MKLLTLSFLALFAANSFASTNKVLVECTFKNTTKTYTPNAALTAKLSGTPGIDVVYVDSSIGLATVSGDANKPLAISSLSLSGNEVTINSSNTIFVGEQIATDDIKGTLIYNAYILEIALERKGIEAVAGTCSFEQ